MDPATRQVYEHEATRWARERHAQHQELARALAAKAVGPTVDLGCGPGWNAADLPPPVVALDGAKAMLDLVAEHAPDAWPVQGDLVALPFRTGALGAGWAHHSYVHVPRADLPRALADLHRSLRLGGMVTLRMFLGDAEGQPFADDEFPGRFFSLWPEAALTEIVESAGFSVVGTEAATDRRGGSALALTAVRDLALPDFVRGGLQLLCVGLNPSVRAAEAGIGYVTPSNRFWSAAVAAGLVARERDPWDALARGIGFTDVAKRPTVRAEEISNDEFRAGFARLERLCAWLQPAAVVFVGLAGWRAAVDRKAKPGRQRRSVGGRPAYLMPSTSGLNASTSLDDLVGHLRAALALARRSRQ